MPKYDIHNPGEGPRVIYDGIKGSMKQITILPGATTRNVELDQKIIDELNERSEKDKTELQLKTASGDSNDDSKTSPAVPRKQGEQLTDKQREARALIDDDPSDFNEFKARAKDVLGDDYPAGTPKKSDLIEALEKVK